MIWNHFQSIWFDLDNTILDFSKSAEEAFLYLMSSYGQSNGIELYPIYKEINRQVWKELEQGIIDQDTLRSKRWSLFFSEIGIQKDPLAANVAFLENLCEKDYLVPNALELLNALKGKVELILVTNGLAEVQRSRVEHHSIKEYFSSIVISDEIKKAKPDVAFFDYTFERSAINQRDKILMVGDTLGSDIQGANNFGIRSVWYNPNEKKSEQVDVDYDVKNLMEILDLRV